MLGGLGWQELLIIAGIALLLFGGTRLAGLGKSAGRSIREFKEETRSIREDEVKNRTNDKNAVGTGEVVTETKVVDAEIVDEPAPRRDV